MPLAVLTDNVCEFWQEQIRQNIIMKTKKYTPDRFKHTCIIWRPGCSLKAELNMSELIPFHVLALFSVGRKCQF